MAQEIYLEEDNKKLVFEPETQEEWKTKVEELGLEGQKKLVEGDNKSPIPFPHMNTAMSNVYGMLCPTHVSVAEYSLTPIPLQVLSMIALCRQENYFDELKIWHSQHSPDPILVGIKKVGDNSWNTESYLIARWGDELDNFEQLKAKAIKMFIIEKTAKLKKDIQEDTNNLANIESIADTWAEGNWVPI